MQGPRRRTARGVVAALLLGSLGLASCTGESVTLGFGPSDVEQVEVFLSPYGDDVSEVSRSVVADRVEIAALVQSLTDVPVRDLETPADEIRGAAAGLRFVLRDGSVSELTQIFVAPKEVVLVWPDGRTRRTDWGAEIGRYGTPADPTANEPVDAEARPRAVIP